MRAPCVISNTVSHRCVILRSLIIRRNCASATQTKVVAVRAPAAGFDAAAAVAAAARAADDSVGDDGDDPLIALLELQAATPPRVQLRASGEVAVAAAAGDAAAAAALLRQHVEAAAAARDRGSSEDSNDTVVGDLAPASLTKAEPAAAASRAGAGAGAAADDGRLRPAAMPFEKMYAQLAAWRARYGVAHVPRHCFDAPALGAWCRWLRRQRARARLPRWMGDRLDLLGFRWALTDEEAKWHAAYHELRRARTIGAAVGIDNISISSSSSSSNSLGSSSGGGGLQRHGGSSNRGGPAAVGMVSAISATEAAALSAWLRCQARLLAKQKLPEHRRAMLARLGVSLRVPRRLVARCAALRGLNAHERRLQRRRWRDADRRARAEEVAQRALEGAERARALAAERGLEEQRARLLALAGGTAAARPARAAQRPKQQPKQQTALPDGAALSPGAPRADWRQAADEPRPLVADWLAAGAGEGGGREAVLIRAEPAPAAAAARSSHSNSGSSHVRAQAARHSSGLGDGGSDGSSDLESSGSAAALGGGLRLQPEGSALQLQPDHQQHDQQQQQLQQQQSHHEPPTAPAPAPPAALHDPNSRHRRRARGLSRHERWQRNRERWQHDGDF